MEYEEERKKVSQVYQVGVWLASLSVSKMVLFTFIFWLYIVKLWCTSINKLTKQQKVINQTNQCLRIYIYLKLQIKYEFFQKKFIFLSPSFQKFLVIHTKISQPIPTIKYDQLKIEDCSSKLTNSYFYSNYTGQIHTSVKEIIAGLQAARYIWEMWCDFFIFLW